MKQGELERRCCAYANLAKTDVANDAAIWNFRLALAATPQSVFAKVTPKTASVQQQGRDGFEVSDKLSERRLWKSGLFCDNAARKGETP